MVIKKEKINDFNFQLFNFKITSYFDTNATKKCKQEHETNVEVEKILLCADSAATNVNYVNLINIFKA